MERAPLFHHARALAHVVHGTVYPARLTELLPSHGALLSAGDDPWRYALYFETAYMWLAARTGFWPLFLAVGSQIDDRTLTGYPNQWRRILSQSRDATVYRQPGTFPNTVLFSYHQEPAGAVFTDFHTWHIVLNAIDWSASTEHRLRQRSISAWEERLVLKRSWSPADWLRKARRAPGSVQAVVPALDLSVADEVWCRNQTTRRQLIALGFVPERVRVQRMPVVD